MMFVKGSLSAQRFITAVDLMDSSKTERLSKQIWMRNWSRVGILSNKTINFLVEWQVKAVAGLTCHWSGTVLSLERTILDMLLLAWLRNSPNIAKAMVSSSNGLICVQMLTIKPRTYITSANYVFNCLVSKQVISQYFYIYYLHVISNFKNCMLFYSFFL